MADQQLDIKIQNPPFKLIKDTMTDPSADFDV